MEELTEVITAAEFHPQQCNVLVYSSSKGTVRLCDMRDNALCDRYSKSKFIYFYLGVTWCLFSLVGITRFELWSPPSIALRSCVIYLVLIFCWFK